VISRIVGLGDPPQTKLHEPFLAPLGWRRFSGLPQLLPSGIAVQGHMLASIAHDPASTNALVVCSTG